MKIVLVVAAAFSVLALADITAQQWGSSQVEHSNVSGTTKLPDLLSMGPDPGGHTGATVTPETTKTGQPRICFRRQDRKQRSTGQRLATIQEVGRRQAVALEANSECQGDTLRVVRSWERRICSSDPTAVTTRKSTGDTGMRAIVRTSVCNSCHAVVE
jgi:hypothetical protein